MFVFFVVVFVAVFCRCFTSDVTQFLITNIWHCSFWQNITYTCNIFKWRVLGRQSKCSRVISLRRRRCRCRWNYGLIIYWNILLKRKNWPKKSSENAANWVDFLKLMYVIYQNQLNLLWNRLEHNLAKIYQKCMYAKAGAKIYQNSLNCVTLVTSLKQKFF